MILLNNQEEITYLSKEISNGNKQIELHKLAYKSYIVLLEEEKGYKMAEKARIAGANITTTLNLAKINTVSIVSNLGCTKAFIEGMALSNYQFLKYFSKKKKNKMGKKKRK